MFIPPKNEKDKQDTVKIQCSSDLKEKERWIFSFAK